MNRIIKVLVDLPELLLVITPEGLIVGQMLLPKMRKLIREATLKVRLPALVHQKGLRADSPLQGLIVAVAVVVVEVQVAAVVAVHLGQEMINPEAHGLLGWIQTGHLKFEHSRAKSLSRSLICPSLRYPETHPWEHLQNWQFFGKNQLPMMLARPRRVRKPKINQALLRHKKTKRGMVVPNNVFPRSCIM